MAKRKMDRRAQKTRRALTSAFVELVLEQQIALLTHWLTGKFVLKPEAVATMLITNTRTLLAGLSGG
ncbi:MAG TPA: hypothetical protein VNO35_18200 [Steroidobacteraceae bacterium]|nr:hypothetical protein [Steroidobacteraceae bacterium]